MALSGPFLHTLLDPQHQMNKPIDLNHPAFFPADLNLIQEVALRFVLAASHSQRLADILDVLLTGQLRHACQWVIKIENSLYHSASK